MSKKIFLLGPDPAKDFMEGGMVRVHYISQAIESLGVPIIKLLPHEVASKKALLKTLVRRPILLASILSPFNKKYLVSNGTTTELKVLSFLSRFMKPLYFDHHDDPRIQLPELGLNVDQAILDSVDKNFEHNLHEYQLIGLSSPGLKKFLPSITKSHFIEVPNASDPSYFSASPLPKEPIVGLIGSTTKNRGADMLIEACELARKSAPKLKLKLALSNAGGAGNLQELKNKYGSLDWVEFIHIDYKDAPEFLKSVKVCAIPHRQNIYVDTVLPIKLFDYMSASRPILSTRCKSIEKLVDGKQVAVLCDFNTQDMAKQLATLLTDDKLCQKLGSNGRKLVEAKYNWQESQLVLTQHIKQALEI